MQMVQKHQKQRDHQAICNHRVIHCPQNLDREGHEIMEKKKHYSELTHDLAINFEKCDRKLN